MTRRLVTNAGESILLTRMLTADDFGIRLISIDFTPSQSLTLAELTPPEFAGYADALAEATDWTIQATADGIAVATGLPKTFEYAIGAATEQIYGAALYDLITNDVITVELFDLPLEITGTSQIEFTPRMQLYDLADAVAEQASTLF